MEYYPRPADYWVIFRSSATGRYWSRTANRRRQGIRANLCRNKEFLAPSTVSEFHTALGQFLKYRVALKVKEPERVLFLAVPVDIYNDFFGEEIAQLSVTEYQVKLLIFNPDREEIVKWIN